MTAAPDLILYQNVKPVKPEKVNGLTAPLKISDSRKKHYQRLGRYAESKRRTRALSKYILQQLPEEKKTAEKLLSCGNYLTFRHYYESDDFRMIRGNSCDKHLLCGICAARRSAKQFYSYRAKYNQIKEQFPNKRIVFFTLTVKNGQDLSERYQHLYSSMAALLQKRRNATKGKTKTALSAISGAVWSYEVTNKGKGWHPHIHGIGLVDDGVDLPRLEWALKAEWESITGDSHQIKVQFPRTKNNEEKAFFEVFKYSLKFSELSFKHQMEVYRVLSGRRLMACFGDFFGVQIVDTDEPEVERDFYDIMYKYDKKTASYRQYHVEDMAIMIDSRLPKAHFREKDISEMNDLDRGLKWQNLMLRYCVKNGLKYNPSKMPSSTMRSITKTKESVRFVKGQRMTGVTIGCPRPLNIVEMISAQNHLKNPN